MLDVHASPDVPEPKDYRPVVIRFREVTLFGYTLAAAGDLPVRLKGARMARYCPTVRDLAELAEEGPPPGSQVSARFTVDVLSFSAIRDCTFAAVKAWEAMTSSTDRYWHLGYFDPVPRGDDPDGR